MQPYTITYEFEFKDGRKRHYEIRIDAKTISIIKPTPAAGSKPWTALERCQCSVCPLKPETSPDCPIALNLSSLVENFKNETSSDQVTVRVKTAERTYLNDTSVQRGLFSIFGIIMATSQCPIMNFLKPMARFHLPFSTHEETLVRSISMYLLRQYFAKKRGTIPDLDLKQLEKKYADVQLVNEGILERIRSVIEQGDADSNAVVILNAFAQLLSLEISDELVSIEYLFQDE